MADDAAPTTEEMELEKLIEEAQEQPGVAELFEVDRRLAELATLEEEAALANEPGSVTGADFALTGDRG